MKELQILKTEISIGLEKPLGILHITDTHVVRDDADRRSHREGCFEEAGKGCIEKYYFDALAHARQHGLVIVHTGDMIDFTSQACLDFMDAQVLNTDMIYAAGNHDFCHWVGEAAEDAAYKAAQMKVCAPHFPCDLYFDARVVGGVNFVTLDDSYYLITDDQLDRLRAEVERGYPIVLCMHVPIYTEDMRGTRRILYAVAAPDDVLATYSEERRRQQTPDEATLRAVEYIKNEPRIKAVIAGHTHENRVSRLTSEKLQIVTHGSFAGFVREITIL